MINITPASFPFFNTPVNMCIFFPAMSVVEIGQRVVVTSVIPVKPPIERITRLKFNQFHKIFSLKSKSNIPLYGKWLTSYLLFDYNKKSNLYYIRNLI